jgi:tetratricopeptide (TPR) repeat protein
VEQILALDESSARCPDGNALEHSMLGLRSWAAWFLNQLGDSAAQSVLIGERLVADCERVLGPDHRDTLTSRNNLALAYEDVGRTDEALTLYEQNLADIERVLGPGHPYTLISRSNLADAYQTAGRTDEAERIRTPGLTDP